MSGPNDAYDPKQVAALTPEALAQAVEDAEKAFTQAADLEELAAVKPAHLGDRSPLLTARREIGALPPKARAEAGKRLNHSRTAVQSAFDQRRAALGVERDARTLREEAVDVTLPWDRLPRGARHPITALMRPHRRHLRRHGIRGRRGPGARGRMVQLRRAQLRPRPPRPHHAGHLLRGARRDPAWCCARTPHRCRSGPCWSASRRSTSSARAGSYRTDELDATHTPVFHQVEGLAVDRGMTMAHLQGHAGPLRRERCSAPTSRTRLRPSFFPFTEPSRRDRRLVPGEEGRPGLGGVGRLRHGQSACAACLRHRSRRVLRLRLRDGHRAHPAVPQRHRRHA